MNTKDRRWWQHERKHESVAALVGGIDGRASRRRALDNHHLRLYSDRQISALTATASTRARSRGPDLLDSKPRLSINVVRNCIDAATSLVTRTRPRATFLTDGAVWDMQQRAKKRGKFVDAVFHSCDAYQLGQRAFKDAAIFGTGLIKVVREHGKVRLEKTFPGELLIDEDEGIYGEPRSFFHLRLVDRLVLAELYPQHARDIEDSSSPSVRLYTTQGATDQVLVIEAWHLPSGPEASDGRHIIVTDKATLMDAEYAHEQPPFAVMRWSEETLGWHGRGVAEELTGIQYEINQLARSIQANMYLGGNLKILVERGSKVISAHLNNDLRGTVVEYTGSPPAWISPDTVSHQAFSHLQWLVDQAYATTGISQMGARGEMPSGISGSGRSMLVYQNVESQRFLTVQRQYERFFMDLAERVLEAAADIHEQDGEVYATYIGDEMSERIGFDEIAGDSDDFAIQVFPTSILPATPAGRIAMIEQLRMGGYIDQGQAKKLLDFPDISTEMDADLAPYELIDERIARIVERGEYFAPHPRMDLALAHRRATLAFQRAELGNIDGARLDMLGQFIDECADLLAAAEQANMAGSSAQAPQPMPVPEAAGLPVEVAA